MKTIVSILFTFMLVSPLAAAKHKICKGFAASDFVEAQAIFETTSHNGRNLTPLHKAAAHGNLDAIVQILAKGARINAADSLGYTAAHFAALLQDKSALELLKSKGANMGLVNFLGATPTDLWDLVHLKNKNAQRINVWDEKLGKVVEIDGFEFCNLTDAYFVESIKMRPQTAMRAWAEAKTSDMERFISLPDIYRKFETRKDLYSDLYIKRILMTNSDGSASDLGYGLFANRDFNAGEVVSDYQGEWRYDGFNGGEYKLGNIDAAQYRGYLGFSADGTPNVESVPFDNKKGVTIGSLAYALKPIKKGEAIMWNYGGHQVKMTNYRELDPEGLNAYLTKKPASQLLRKVEDATRFDIEFRSALIHLSFIKDTPTVFIRLLLENRIKSDDVRRLFADSRIGRSHIEKQINNILSAIDANLESQAFRSFFAAKAKKGQVKPLLHTLMLVSNLGGSAMSSELLQQLWDLSFRDEL